uniref:Uncharacterized protein n=1 Tax=Arundo donax TaxID=35708 RepID=A0A0A9EEK7_ARUDO
MFYLLLEHDKHQTVFLITQAAITFFCL